MLAPSAPFYALMLFLFGGLWLSLWRRSWRLFGLIPLTIGLLLWNTDERADVLIDREGAVAAVRTVSGALAFTDEHPTYTAEMWLLHDGDMRVPKEAAISAAIKCEKESCVYREKGRKVIAFPQTLAALAEDCEHAAIIVATVPIPRRVRRRCGAELVIDKFDLWRNGAMSLTFEEDGEVRIATSRAARGERPWARDPLKLAQSR